jgi:hypothetical protein
LRSIQACPDASEVGKLVFTLPPFVFKWAAAPDATERRLGAAELERRSSSKKVGQVHVRVRLGSSSEEEGTAEAGGVYWAGWKNPLRYHGGCGIAPQLVAAADAGGEPGMPPLFVRDAAVRAALGRLSGLSVSLCKSVLHGAFCMGAQGA